jgi:hypothetical protein
MSHYVCTTRRFFLQGSALLSCSALLTGPADAQAANSFRSVQAYLNEIMAFDKAGGPGKGVADRPSALKALENMQKLVPAVTQEIAAFLKGLAKPGEASAFDADVVNYMQTRKAPPRIVEMGKQAGGAVAVLRRTNAVLKADINNRRRALGLRKMSDMGLLEKFLAALNPIGRAEAIEGFCGIVHFWTWVTVRSMEKVTGTASGSSDSVLESANKNCY